MKPEGASGLPLATTLQIQCRVVAVEITEALAGAGAASAADGSAPAVEEAATGEPVHGQAAEKAIARHERIKMPLLEMSVFWQ